MPRDEGKDADDEGKDGDDSAPNLPPLVVAFCSYCTERAFETAVTDFFEARCGPFRGADLGEEQKLEYTDVHRDYVDLIENQLEAFCKERDVVARDVFRALGDVASDPSIDRDFVPSVVRNAEYEFFFSNMKAYAELSASKRAAEDAAEDARGKSYNLSGVWKFDNARYDKRAADRQLAKAGCPWAFRKILVNANTNLTDAFVTQDRDALTVKYKLPFFGTNAQTHALDGERHDMLNAWRQARVSRSWIEDGAVHGEITDPKRPGYKTTQTMAIVDDELHWTITSGDASGEARVTNFLVRA